ETQLPGGREVIVYPHLTAADSAYMVDFGDGTVVQELVHEGTDAPAIRHTYEEDGSFLILYRVFTRLHGSCEQTREVQIGSMEPLMCEFEYDLDGTTFIGSPPENDHQNIEYRWTFGDGSDATDTSYVAHTYASSGKYTVCLEMFRDNESCRSCQEITVERANQTDSMYIHGSLFADLIPVDAGVVELYQKDNEEWLKIAESVTDQGSFKFEDLSRGEYLMYARGNEQLHFAFIPTYFVNGISWTDAYHLQLDQSAVEVKITLIRAEGLNEEGEGKIAGRIINSEQGEQETVILLQDLISKRVLKWTMSDENQSFQFTDLPFGRYQIKMEKPGDSFVKAFELTENAPEILNFEMNPGVVSDTDNELSQDFLKVFPTSVSEYLKIQNTRNYHQSLQIEFFSTAGNLVLSDHIHLGASQEHRVDLSGLQPGLLILRVRDEAGTSMIKRLIKE
ncbi:MAG: PKD domain-containing protein, partial [Bacteroidota bacterium]